MSEPGRKRVRRGELRRVRCRVCSKVINFQSYSDHLKLSHPEEDPKDRRELGQRSLVVKKVVEVEEGGDYVTMEETSEAVEVEGKEDEVAEVENDVMMEELVTPT